jgi:hypothetical protein
VRRSLDAAISGIEDLGLVAIKEICFLGSSAITVVIKKKEKELSASNR